MFKIIRRMGWCDRFSLAGWFLMAISLSPTLMFFSYLLLAAGYSVVTHHPSDPLNFIFTPFIVVLAGLFFCGGLAPLIAMLEVIRRHRW